MPSSATEVAIRILLSPSVLNASNTHFCTGRVIPVSESEGRYNSPRGNFTLEKIAINYGILNDMPGTVISALHP